VMIVLKCSEMHSEHFLFSPDLSIYVLQYYTLRVYRRYSMNLPLPPLSKLRSKRSVVMLLVAVLVVELFTLSGISYFRNSNSYATVHSSTNEVLTQSKSSLTTNNTNASGTGTITVHCGCKKQTTGQPGQTSTNGSVLQGGSSQSTQSPTCNPCAPVGGAESAGVMCPEYLCRASTPTPTPTPTPIPSPPSHCLPCGYRESGAASAGYACPMLCVE
jgi:hypothetical protein